MKEAISLIQSRTLDRSLGVDLTFNHSLLAMTLPAASVLVYNVDLMTDWTILTKRDGGDTPIAARLRREPLELDLCRLRDGALWNGSLPRLRPLPDPDTEPAPRQTDAKPYIDVRQRAERQRAREAANGRLAARNRETQAWSRIGTGIAQNYRPPSW